MVTNLKGGSFYVEKTEGNYCSIYHRTNFLNTELVADFPFLFSSLFIDLRDIKTETRTALDKPSMVRLFEDHLRGDSHSSEALRRKIAPTTNTLYTKGI